MKWNGGKKPTLSKLENVFTRFVCWASWLLWMVFYRYLSGNGCAVMVRSSGATFERIHDRMLDLILRQIRKKSEEKVDDCSLGRGWPSRVVKWGSWPRPNSNSKPLFVDLIVLFPHSELSHCTHSFEFLSFCWTSGTIEWRLLISGRHKDNRRSIGCYWL